MEQKFGKITVETCEADGVEIEGLKVITPSVSVSYTHLTLPTT